jgi:hypothetical protein
MSQEMELVGEYMLQDYSMSVVAQEYGPGDYTLLLSASTAGLWGPHNCLVRVAPEFARANGWEPYPQQLATVPKVSEARALQGMATALQPGRALQVEDLALMQESLIEKTVTAVMAAMRNAAPPAPVNGMGPDQVLTFMSGLDAIRQSGKQEALEMFKMFNGHEAGDGPAPRDDSWSGALGGLLSQALPGILAAFKPQPAAPAVAATVQEVPAVIVPMNPEEMQEYAGAVRMLRPFLPHILQLIGPGAVIDQAAAQLAEYIPAPLMQELVNLAALTAARGPNVLALIDPQLATTRGAELIAAVARLLTGE